MDEDPGDRLRRHAEDWSGLGEEWIAGGDNLHPSKYGSGDRDARGDVSIGSAVAGTEEDRPGVSAIVGGVGGGGENWEGGKGVGFQVSRFQSFKVGVPWRDAFSLRHESRCHPDGPRFLQAGGPVQSPAT